MNPVKAALWISKFVVMLVLLLVVVPAILFYGGLFAVAKYHKYKEARYEVQQAAALKKVCSEWEAKHSTAPAR